MIDTQPLESFGDVRLPKAFWRKVQVDSSGCWLWTGWLKPDGYARYCKTYVHRLAYEVFIGPIAAGLQVDHLCHDPNVCTSGDLCPHRRCVNPDHLEAVTGRENALRSGGTAALNVAKTHCPKGHPYDRNNTLRDGRKRRCAICRSEQLRKARIKYLAKTRTAA